MKRIKSESGVIDSDIPRAESAPIVESSEESPSLVTASKAPSLDYEAVGEPTSPTEHTTADTSAASPLNYANGEAKSSPVAIEETLSPSGTGSHLDANGPTQELPRHQVKFMLSMVRSLKRLKDAFPFLAPVDPVKLNIPTYFDVVKQPMDLSTIEKNLQDGKYISVDEYVADYELMVNNCILFNGLESKIADMARNMKASFERQLKQMPPAVLKSEPQVSKSKKKSPKQDATEPSFALQPSGVPIIRRDSVSDGRPKREIHPPRPKDLPYSDVKPRRKKFVAELKFCGTVLKELTSKKFEAFSFPFLQPVDPVALNCPSYFKIIKKPMDLSTIQNKYNTNQYETANDFEEDIRLMFRNCYKFNPDSSPVNVMGHRLELVFDKKWAEKPLPPPPASRVTESPVEDDDSSEEDDDDDDDASEKTISLLEQQLTAMQTQLSMMKKKKKENIAKKEKKRKYSTGSVSRKAASGLGKRRNSKPASSSAIPHVSYDMKKELSDKITTLPAQKINHVVKIIHESMPHLKNSGDEIELDVDQLDPNTLMKLYNYVIKNTPGSTVRTPTTGTSKSGSKTSAKKKSQLDRKEESSEDESSSEDDSDASESSSEEE
ncbi:Bromodomain-containing protein [Dipodascopsis tothii]|uniref:Bromodomain-containing protein n=1 Tax=Dipodascopsis tothii TaxID=44089 RepID=UPI0034CF9B4C